MLGVTPTDQTLKAPTIRTSLQQHAGLLLSGSLIVICAMRILLFAKGDIPLALAILNVGQQFTILTSTLFTALPLVALFAYFNPRTTQYFSIDAKSRDSTKFAAVQGLVFAIGGPLLFLVLPVILLGVALAGLVGFAAWTFVQYLLSRNNKKWTMPRLVRQFFLWVVTAAVMVQCLVVIFLPWVPSEKIIIKNGGENKTTYGYVIGQQGKQTMILNMKHTAVTWVSEDDLGDRSICNESSPFTDWYWKPYAVAFSDSKDLAEPAREDCKD